MEYRIQKINAQNFAKYGGVLEAGTDEGFEVFFNETEKVGWRLAVSTLENTAITKLARHPNTVESFAPLQGIALICVSAAEEPAAVEVFLLDKPIYIEKSIWHGTLSLSGQAVLTICENVSVDSEEYILEQPLEALVKGGG